MYTWKPHSLLTFLILLPFEHTDNTKIVKLKLVSTHSYVHLLLLISAQRACKKIIEFQWYLLFHFKYFDTWIPKMQDDGKMRNF